jgi:hypothetical protein
VWPEVLSALNPSGDAAVAALLERIRAPHVFNPGLALKVIEAGCRDVGMAASGLDALRAAAASTERVVGCGLDVAQARGATIDRRPRHEVPRALGLDRFDEP